MQTELLQYETFYHIYNQGINGCPIFRENKNHDYFLGLYHKYVSPVADTYAWVLMGNHFHFLVRIKSQIEINTHFSKLKDYKNLDGSHKNRPTQQFSNLFNAYTKAYNKMYFRTGSLFEKNFKRKKVDNLSYLQYLVYYIHHNPIHHNFCDYYLDYPWSSYLTILSPKKTHLSRKEVLKWYNNTEGFISFHDKTIDLKIIADYLIDKPVKITDIAD